MGRRNEWIYATDAQEAYMRRLWAALWPESRPFQWVNRRLLKSEASRLIDDLKRRLDAQQRESR